MSDIINDEDVPALVGLNAANFKSPYKPIW